MPTCGRYELTKKPMPTNKEANVSVAAKLRDMESTGDLLRVYTCPTNKRNELTTKAMKEPNIKRRGKTWYIFLAGIPFVDIVELLMELANWLLESLHCSITKIASRQAVAR